MVFKCSISALLVLLILFANSEDQKEISTKITITKTNKVHSCQHEGDIQMEDGDEFEVEVTHKHFINFVLLSNPTQKQVEVSEGKASDGLKLHAKYNISEKQAGDWVFKTLTGENASKVDGQANYMTYKGHIYHVDKCEFSIKVTVPWIKNWVYWMLIGIGILTLIIVIQTFVICHILKKKNIRRIEQLALSNSSRSNSNTARYSTTPGLKLSKPKANDDCGSIYESLDEIQSANAAPPPPPIETLPRPPKKDKVPLIPGNSSQHSTLSRNPVTEEDRVKNRPKLPLPTEVNGASLPFQSSHNETPTTTLPKPESNLSTRAPNKVKLPPFCSPSQIPPSPNRPAPKMSKKLPIKDDPLANELNNILKRRQTGAGVALKPSIPEKSETIPETKPKPATGQGIKPPTFSKPTTPIKQLPKPMGPTKGTLPKSPSKSPAQQPLMPTLAPKPAGARKWPPVNTQGTQLQPSHTPPTQNSHPKQTQPHTGPGRGQPMHRPAHPSPHPVHPTPHSVHPTPQQQRKLPPLPVQPAGPEKEPECADYAEYEKYGEHEEYEEFQDFENEEDDEDWTYELLPQYNIYCNTDELARVSNT